MTATVIEPADCVFVYGELCGGHYPHPDVCARPVQPVQRGIWYSPDIRFVAYDVAVRKANGQEHAPLQYLDFDTAASVCGSCGLYFIPVLFRGSLAECFDFPFRFVSTISTGLFKLPPLPEDPSQPPNYAEGVVVRAAKEFTAQTAKGPALRPLLKRKIPEFQESRFANDDWEKGKAGGAGWSDVNPEQLASYEVLSRITPQRVDNALSKIGRVATTDQKACRLLLNEFKNDVLESLEEADRHLVQSSPSLRALLDTESKKLIAKHLRAIEKSKK